jgi:acetate kinase
VRVNVLVINAGSSSLKVTLLSLPAGERAGDWNVERVGAGGPADHAAALTGLLAALEGARVDAVAHRVVHGGEAFGTPALIDDAVEAGIEALIPLAPLHNPANLQGIRAARSIWAGVPHIAVFDTAFHATLPHRAQRYALPWELAQKHGLRRYGFHGPSHRWVAGQAASFLRTELKELRLITLHLGGGCSAAAIEFGRSVETSMGMTPLEGLVMGSRSGDVDPGVLLELMRREGLDVDGLDRLLNKDAGLAGLSGVGKDIRDILARAADGDPRCQAAMQVFCHRARKYVGAYAAVLGGVDAIVFTAGIGENAAEVRHRIAQRLDYLGAVLDEDRNRAARVGVDEPVVEISAPYARCRLLVVKTDEARCIAEDAAAVVDGLGAVNEAPPIPIKISARHVHLTAQAVFALFGEGHKLTPRAPLGQPGQFVCEERVDVVGPKRSIEKVAIIGPVRRDCQVEVSRTDEFHLGVDAPIRGSGHVEGSPGITLVGPAGSLTIEQGVIQAQRHIHMRPEDAEAYGVADGEFVEVEVSGGERDLVFRDVLIRVKSSYALEMHIDTDEANAADLGNGSTGALVATSGVARVVGKRW